MCGWQVKLCVISPSYITWDISNRFRDVFITIRRYKIDTLLYFTLYGMTIDIAVYCHGYAIHQGKDRTRHYVRL